MSDFKLPIELEECLASLATLPKGWDGYDGIPVGPAIVVLVRYFLTAIEECGRTVPDVVPLSNGGVQLEWVGGVYKVEMEVEISPRGEIQVYLEEGEER